MTHEKLLERIQKRWSALQDEGDCTCWRCLAQEAVIAVTEDGLITPGSPDEPRAQAKNLQTIRDPYAPIAEGPGLHEDYKP